MVKVIGRLDPGERCECFADETAIEPYLIGAVAKVTATRTTVKVLIDVDESVPEVTVEEDEPEEPTGGFPRPSGWT